MDSVALTLADGNDHDDRLCVPNFEDKPVAGTAHDASPCAEARACSGLAPRSMAPELDGAQSIPSISFTSSSGVVVGA